ncbi:replication protein RepA, partial [Pleomorphomonas koreensis]|uniref:replication protein RepA n=1 Tax=Pleomorphomonas koreensis TaxID=257440 RepID=UPI001AEBC4F9
PRYGEGMNQADESQVRDADLLERLSAKKGTSAYQFELLACVSMQSRRDEESKKSQAKAAALAAMPREKRRRAIIREVIENEGPSPDNLRFMPTPLAICGLPYKALPPGQTEFERSQGRMAVTVTAGKLRSPDGQRIQQPVPFGPKARLIMAHLSTEALRNNSPVVETSETLTGFMRDMGFDPRGGRNGNIEPFKEQLRALAACRMEISTWDGRRSGQVDVKPLQKVELWFPDHPDQKALWPTQIAFSQDFYDEIKRHALPIDVRVLRALSNSARRLDLMLWVTYRITRLNAKLILDWQPLKSQFGEGYARDRAFREAFVEDVAALRDIFPKLPLRLTERGLEMEAADASALAIPKRKA